MLLKDVFSHASAAVLSVGIERFQSQHLEQRGNVINKAHPWGGKTLFGKEVVILVYFHHYIRIDTCTFYHIICNNVAVRC